ncbi:outer membrane protein assembly factor [Marinilongibacter aquaticus]|uniref:outer membrane protein assembly factor n=1 Tax=Marinilongibacter aquaticus TaxID=2975157 RepID=UPI0021BD8709|nr:outer membrane protein assembly factor [Marinilongibacter aquaticus]UBM60488.1 outer membrane protein assembly factor [Marinilongibacter aquaticus]
MNRLVVLVFLLFSTAAFSQGYYDVTQEEFGQNRIQIRKLNWKTIQSNNFEFNFYRGGDELAVKAAKIAEGEYKKITNTLGYTPFTTIKIFLYNNKNQLSQSNIGLTSPILYDGGILNLSRSRIEIPYTGSDSLFRQELVKEISNLFVYDMLYGGSLKEVLQSSLMLTVPEWYMKGIAAYIASESDTPEFAALAQETILKNANKRINGLTGRDAEIIGQSIWNYIAVKYGRDNISNILNLTRIIRAEQSSITSTLGISFNQFLHNWKDFYMNGAKVETEVEEEPVVENKVPLNSGVAPLENLRSDEVDTEYYTFDPENVKSSSLALTQKSEEKSSTFDRKKLAANKEELKISPTKAYQNLLLTQDLKTTFFNDPVRRLGMYNTLTLNDLLENHIIQFKLFFTPSIKNHDLGVKYMNYENRVDWGFSFNRRSIYFDQLSGKKQNYLFLPFNSATPNPILNRRLYLHEFNAHVSYPFSNHLKVLFTPHVYINNDIDYFELSKKALSSTLAGLKAEIVYDNTVQSVEHGQMVGTRAKLAYEKNIGFSKDNSNFNRMYLDIRHYRPITKGLVIAGRFNYGKSNGQSPKYSFLGGMENTLNRSVYDGTTATVTSQPTDIRDIVFYNYPGSLRGFQFGKLYGTNYMLFNAELRFALGSLLSRSSVTSNVIRNLQFVLFGDSGTAWNGNKGPWSKENSLNTQTIGSPGDPFSAVVTNFKNPFLFGYGGGVRTTILGIYVKADYAFGVENKSVNAGRFYLSLGHDF